MEKTITVTRNIYVKCVADVLTELMKQHSKGGKSQDPMFDLLTSMTCMDFAKRMELKLFGEEETESNGTED